MRNLNAELRQLIDTQDVSALGRFLTEHPDHNLNDITQNHLSALWYAITPPHGKKPAVDIIRALTLSLPNRVNPTLEYNNFRIKSFLTHLDEIRTIIATHESMYRTAPIAREAHDEQAFAANSQNTHDSRVVSAVDEAIIKLFRRYSLENASTTIENLERFIQKEIKRTEGEKYADEDTANEEKIAIEQLHHATSAIKRIMKNNTAYEYRVSIFKTISLNAKDVLVLMFKAASSTNATHFTRGAGMTPAENRNRQRLLLRHLSQTETEYVHENGRMSSACGMGTRNGIVSSLDMIHVDIQISCLHAFTPDVVLMHYRAFCAKKLSDLEKTQPTLFKQYLRYYAFRDLGDYFDSASEAENIPADIKLFIDAIQNEFLRDIKTQNKENANPVDEKDKTKKIKKSGKPDEIIIIPGLERIITQLFKPTNGCAVLDDSQCKSIVLIRKLLELNAGCTETSPLSRLIPPVKLPDDFTSLDSVANEIKKNLIDNVDLASLYNYLTTHSVAVVENNHPYDQLETDDKKKEWREKNPQEFRTTYASHRQNLIASDEYKTSSLYCAVEIIQSLFAFMSTDKKNSVLEKAWPALFVKLLEQAHSRVPESLLWKIIQEELATTLPEIKKWLALLPEDISVVFFKELHAAHYFPNANPLSTAILGLALAFALKNGVLNEFPFQDEMIVKDRDFRGTDLSKINLNKITFKNCDLRLTGLEEPKVSIANFSKIIDGGNVFDVTRLPDTLLNNPDFTMMMTAHRDQLENLSSLILSKIHKNPEYISLSNIDQVISSIEPHTRSEDLLQIFRYLLKNTNPAVLYNKLDHLDALFKQKTNRGIADLYLHKSDQFKTEELLIFHFPQLLNKSNSLIMKEITQTIATPSALSLDGLKHIRNFLSNTLRGHDQYLYQDVKKYISDIKAIADKLIFNEQKRPFFRRNEIEAGAFSNGVNGLMLSKMDAFRVIQAHEHEISKPKIAVTLPENEILRAINNATRSINLYQWVEPQYLKRDVIEALLSNAHCDTAILEVLAMHAEEKDQIEKIINFTNINICVNKQRVLVNLLSNKAIEAELLIQIATNAGFGHQVVEEISKHPLYLASAATQQSVIRALPTCCPNYCAQKCLGDATTNIDTLFALCEKTNYIYYITLMKILSLLTAESGAHLEKLVELMKIKDTVTIGNGMNERRELLSTIINHPAFSEKQIKQFLEILFDRNERSIAAAEKKAWYVPMINALNGASRPNLDTALIIKKILLLTAIEHEIDNRKPHSVKLYAPPNDNSLDTLKKELIEYTSEEMLKRAIAKEAHRVTLYNACMQILNPPAIPRFSLGQQHS